jgi:hypothetical protein
MPLSLYRDRCRRHGHVGIVKHQEGAVNVTVADGLWGLGIFFVIVGWLWAIDRRTRRSELMVSDIVNYLGLSGASMEEASDEVKALAADPSKFLDAIKAYRTQTGLGLREAKDVIERLSRKAKLSGV